MSDLVKELEFVLRDWDGKSKIHLPSINALTVKRALDRIEELESANQWQPIETCPKNQTVVSSDKGEWRHPYAGKPPHWMPLPQPPEGEE